MSRLSDSRRSDGISALSSGILVLNFLSFIWPRCRRLLRSSRRLIAASRLSAPVKFAQLQSIWRMDAILGEDSSLRPEEQSAVRHFQDTHQRQQDGRYVVKLPRKDDTPILGRSREQAVKRYLSNECRLNKEGKLADLRRE